ncbi:hypothetical protein CTI12_AA248690 [Artemisia annua]|uniref:Uncharacterized protein n=1 Tax=Artemisia annua TaxID=35608 RepID=A0A2U1NMQ5_ARTAN|nr:hypothetical protein CTI12_AA248690 [Artemisia annua]
MTHTTRWRAYSENTTTTPNPKDDKVPSKDQKKKDDKKDEDLSEEDLALKQQLELYVERVQDPDPALQKVALESMRNRISPDPIFLTSEASSLGGFYAVNRRGQVLLATVNEAAIVPFVSGQLNNLELAVNLAKRGNLPGAENLVVQRFQELFAQTKYKEAAELAADSPQGILRTPDTVAKFQSVPVQAGQTPPLLQYFGTLLTKGKLNAFESLELSRLVLLNEEAKVDDLIELVEQIVAFHMKHNAEPEAVDLLMEVEDLDLLGKHVDKTSSNRTCLYLTSSARMWFHRPVRADEWLLFVITSPSAHNARGFVSG